MGNDTSPRKPPAADAMPREPLRDGGSAEAAFYIMEAMADLTRLAQRHRLDMLAYLLDMAHLEAKDVVRLKGQRK